MTKRWSVAWTILVLCGTCFSAEPTPPDRVDPVAILNTSSFWRVHYTLRPPVVRDGRELRKLPTLTGETPAPPAEWTRIDFNDSKWTRTSGKLFPARSFIWKMDRSVLAESGIIASNNSSPALALICLRGKFGVTDPAAVKSLKLSLAYHGGAVVYLNGREVGRADMAGDAAGPGALAEDYPRSAFLRTDGSPVMSEVSVSRQNDTQALPAWKSRVRRATIPIPNDALRKGTNLLAVEIHRAPYHPRVREWIRDKDVPNHIIPTFLWATCGLLSVKLESPSPTGLTPNVERPKGWQLWNSQVMQQDFDVDWGDPFERLRPIRLVGSRRGVFSGKVIVGRDQPITGLKARISDFVRKDGGAKIAASAVKVRYGLPTGSEPVGAARYPVPARLFDGLIDAAPALVDVPSKSTGGWSSGAVCPVWVTAAVPADAAPGDYHAKLTITAEDAAGPFEVPVQLKVCSWRLPEPREFRTIVDLIQSPESVAMHYGVPIYGEEHFQLLEKSLERMGYVGNWTVHIPLICQTNLGNEQSMVRWIRKPDGTYRFDFSPMDRYLNLAVKHMGKPRIVFLIVWDFFLGTAGQAGVHPQIQKIIPGVEDIPISMLDEATGKVSMGTVGRYDEKGKANWKALVAELMAHLKKRGLDKRILVAMANDVYPTAEIVAFWKELLPGVAWGRYGHFEEKTLGGTGAPIGYQAHAFAPSWGTRPMYGWKRPDRTVLFFRTNAFGSRAKPWHSMPWDVARLLAEINIQGPRRGFGRIGLDFWPVLTNVRGRKVGGIQGRYPKSFWRQLDMMVPCLVPPGPDGALATGKLEMMREGLQETEARIFLESVLTDPRRRGKLPDALADKAEQVLDERMRALVVNLERQQITGFTNRMQPWMDGYGAGDFRGNKAAIFRQWYLTSGWQQRSEKLYNVAADVAAALDHP